MALAVGHFRHYDMLCQYGFAKLIKCLLWFKPMLLNAITTCSYLQQVDIQGHHKSWTLDWTLGLRLQIEFCSLSCLKCPGPCKGILDHEQESGYMSKTHVGTSFLEWKTYSHCGTPQSKTQSKYLKVGLFSIRYRTVHRTLILASNNNFFLYVMVSLEFNITSICTSAAL